MPEFETEAEYMEYYYGASDDAQVVDLAPDVIDDIPGYDEDSEYWYCGSCQAWHKHADLNACPEFDKLPFEEVS